MTKEQEKNFETEVKRTFEEVRFQALKAGAKGILGAVLNMCNENKSVDEIKEFCTKLINMDGVK